MDHPAEEGKITTDDTDSTDKKDKYFLIRAIRVIRGWSSLLVLLLVVVGCRGRAPWEGKSVAELEAMLRDADPNVQAQGAYGLSRLGGEARPAVKSLAEALKKGDARVRQNAALALAQIGPEAQEAVPALAEALGDPE